MLAALTFIAASDSDHSTIGVIDREARVALRGQLAAEIKREIGASTDGATTVVDHGIKSAAG